MENLIPEKLKSRSKNRNRKLVIWSPQAKQIEALERTEKEILYGGARGGGKTDAGMAWMLYEKENPLYRGLVIRLNAKDLADWIDRARRMYRATGAEFVGSPTEIRFPSGALIRTGHLKDENAYTQYQGHEYQKILIEELTQIPEEKYYEQLISSCRSTVEGIQPQVFCTTNPGGLGHAWVKARWNIRGIPQEMILTKTDTGDRVFIPARVEDNPILMEKDPFYVRMLEGIKDANLRKAWREGDWDNPIVPGLIYQDELIKAKAEGRITNVPYNPKFPVYTYWDVGRDATPIIFMQKIEDSWNVIDFYEASNKDISHFAKILQEKHYVYGQHFGPHDLEKNYWTTTESMRVTAERLGIYFEVAKKTDRWEGINAVKLKFGFLRFDETKTSLLLDRIGAYRREWDDNKMVFKDIPVHDWASHACDALRVWAMLPDPVLPGQIKWEEGIYSNQTYT